MGSRSRGWFWLVVLIVAAACILFLLEWIGSERPQKMMEQSVTAPAPAPASAPAKRME